uniref:Small ribosomal subunit protein uS4c n=1 Tax=Sciaphila thaidanica TaxID=2161793 RepID=A0A2R4PAL7_9LILI|nr:ribosomal protein S4 [Sciaphila thaidanica]
MKKKKSGYHICLEEKQKLRFYYDLTDKQLFRYIDKKKISLMGRILLLLQLLEMRLDRILLKLGISPNIFGTKKIINQGHVIINNYMVNLSTYCCIPGDVINIIIKRKKILIHGFITSIYIYHQIIPKYLTVDFLQYKGIINQIINEKIIDLKIDDLFILEYYYYNAKL